LIGGSANFLISKYAVFQPNDAEYLTHIEKLSNLYKQVKRKYDTTIWVWLNYVNKFEGKDVALHWKDVVVSELKAELPNTEFDE